MMKSVIQTNHAIPSQSLKSRICYPEAFKFSTKLQGKWWYIYWYRMYSNVYTCYTDGNEQDVVKAYKLHVEFQHKGFKIEGVGLFSHPDDPYIGASPDRIAYCDWHGKGVLEVKCPFCMKDGLPLDDKDNVFMELKNGKWILKHDHVYFYQVQTPT